MRNSIKFIYFDLAGVQYDFQTGISQFVRERGVSYEDFAEKVGDVEEQVNRGELPIEKLIEVYNETLGVHLKGKEEYLTFWTSLFQPILPMHALVKELSARYPIGIITNIHETLFERLLEKNLLVDITYRSVIQSFHIHHVKPEKEIYLLAQQKAKVQPQEILFIDDNVRYIQAAKELGWLGIVFDQKNLKDSFRKIKDAMVK